MNRKITIWCIGLFAILFMFPGHSMSAPVRKPVLDSVYYYIKVDTSGVDLGYLKAADAEGGDVTLSAGATKGDDFAMWKVLDNEPMDTDNKYTLVNRKCDTLRFDPVRTQTDTVATIRAGGICNIWLDLVFNEDSRNQFETSYREDLVSYTYYLTMRSDGVVMFSAGDSENPQLNFSIERVSELPDPATYYRLKVDTTGVPGVAPLGFLSADTINRPDGGPDTLAVAKTLRDDLSLWKFEVDTIVYDTTFFQLRNKGTGNILAFDIPGQDTIACLKEDGTLNQWRIPFFMEENGIGRLMVRDTLAHKDYYLGLQHAGTQDTIVMLAADTVQYRCLKFVIEEDGYVPALPDSSIVDSTMVYKVKYVNGPYAGKYLGANPRGRDSVLLNKVYAHLPDGQFVVYRDNKYTLMNRAGNVTTGRYTRANENEDKHFYETDSLSVVYDDSGEVVPNRYTTKKPYDETGRRDTFEILPIDFNIATEKLNPYLGYKYLRFGELSSFSYAFSYTSADTLNGRVIGYDPADSLAVLLAEGDTMQFVLEVTEPNITQGAPAIAGIPALERLAYRLRSKEDSTLYFSVQADSLAVDTIPYTSSFFLKEDTVLVPEPEKKGYYFIENSNTVSVRKLLADSTKHFNLVPIDSTDTHLFELIQKDRYVAEEDPYEYLTELLYGRGLYELSADVYGESRYLTKNYYHYAVLGKEGESMLRSGSYTPADFHLWIDTARGPGYNPVKPSFYIVKDVDSTSLTALQPLNISGYFLHVMDSASLSEHDDYVVEIDGKTYNRVNFVKAHRRSAGELLLDTTSRAQFRDSVGFAGKNEQAINEYRFYLQYVDENDNDDRYYIVTEQGYGGKPGVRGYLSINPSDNPSDRKLYVGPRDGVSIVPLTVFRASMVSNEVIPPVVEEVTKKITVIGGNGQVDIRNATGLRVIVYNVVGQQVADKILTADQETIPVSRGVLIVKIGDKTTRKVIVR